MRDAISHDPYTTLVSLLDDGFMLFYRHVRRNARRITNLVVTLVPLMALLVGSCKTSQTSDNIINGAQTGAQQFQAALFPDQASFHGVHYAPAAGYVSQARNFVEAMPQMMMMLTRDDIGYLFGKPTFHRRDADAEVWQYKTGACVVDFYFYGKKQLSYVDARRKDQTPASGHEESKCLHNIDKKDFDSSQT
jgi:hypothetical protein